MLLSLLVALGCPNQEDAETDPEFGLGIYYVDVFLDPDPPVARQPVDVQLQVVGPDGKPVSDLTQIHERMVHTFLISRDLTSFSHIHHEDFGEIDGENLREARFEFPYTFPYSGDFFFSFEFANQGEYRNSSAWANVAGDVPQLGSPPFDPATIVESGGVRAELVWDVAPVAGRQAALHLYLTTLEGADVIDIVPFLGADGHAAIVAQDFAAVGHTHAWVEGMDDAPPGHPMPHLYDGPALPFRHTFPIPGIYKIWAQFTRAGAPDQPVTVSFMFEVPAS